MRGQEFQSAAGDAVNDLTFHFADAAARLKNIRGVIWDLDHTLYCVDDRVQKNFSAAVSLAAIENGLPLTMAEAQATAIESFVLHGNSATIFVKQYGLDQRKMHFDYHARADASLITPIAGLPAAFAVVGRAHILLTHGSRNWAERVVAHIGLAKVFPAENILALEDCEFRSKHNDRFGFNGALAKLKMEPREVAMVEDSKANLNVPHELGILTVYVRHERPLPTSDQIDVSCKNAAEFLLAMK